MAVEIEYQLTSDDYAAFVAKARRDRAAIQTAFLAALMVGAYVMNADPLSLSAEALVPLGLGLLIMVALLYFIARVDPLGLGRFVSRLLFARMKNLHHPSRVIFSDDGIDSASTNGTGSTKWCAYNRFATTDQLLILYTASRVGYMFPRRAFSDEGWTAVLALLKEKLPGR